MNLIIAVYPVRYILTLGRLCVTRDDVKAAVLAHCEAVGIFDAAPIVAWALEDESHAINLQAIQGGGPHTGVHDDWLIY